MSFGTRLADASDRFGGLCVGIDPHPHLLRAWGLSDSAQGGEEFGLLTVAAAAGRVAVVKPQVAFFERWGAAGYAALERVMGEARAAGLIVLVDAKRGDIGSTQAAYGEAWLRPGAPLEADAVTVSPYLGLDALRETFDLAREHGKGAFVLAATSNPHAELVQAAQSPSGTVAAEIETGVIALADQDGSSTASIGLVIGATLGPRIADYGFRFDPRVPILAPGFGAQGAALTARPTLIPSAAVVLASVSRSVLDAGPEGLSAAIDQAKDELA